LVVGRLVDRTQGLCAVKPFGHRVGLEESTHGPIPAPNPHPHSHSNPAQRSAGEFHFFPTPPGTRARANFRLFSLPVATPALCSLPSRSRFEERTNPETGKRYRVALPEVDIKLQKVRNKDIGTQGEAYLLYDRATGRYEDPALAEAARSGGGAAAAAGAGSSLRLRAGSGPGGGVAVDRVQLRNVESGYKFDTG
jgi:hypothetical protein